MQRGRGQFQRVALLLQRASQHIAPGAGTGRGRRQRGARQADAQPQLQAHEGGPHARQEMVGVGMDHIGRADLQPLDGQRRRMAAAQRDQVQVGAALQARRIAGQRGHEGLCTVAARDGNGHHEATRRHQVGGPGHAPAQCKAVGADSADSADGRGLDLQGFDAAQVLHGVGQARGARLRALQQARQPALAQRRVGRLQQVFDKGALRPEHEARRQRMPGHAGNGLQRIAQAAALPALGHGHAQAEQAVLRQPGQHLVRMRGAFVQGVGMGVQPLPQRISQHVRSPAVVGTVRADRAAAAG